MEEEIAEHILKPWLNPKGKPCSYKPVVCQEGMCDTCMIFGERSGLVIAGKGEEHTGGDISLHESGAAKEVPEKEGITVPEYLPAL